MKVFYICAVGFFLILVYGDYGTDIEEHVAGVAALLILLLAIAVLGIEKRIERAVSEIRNPDFDAKAANREEWIEFGKIVFLALAIIVVATLVQGFYRCLLYDEPVSVNCIWREIQDQVHDDFN